MTSKLTLDDITHPQLKQWIADNIALTNPAKVYIADGSQEEADALFQQMIDRGQCIKLTERENSYYFRSDPKDVARVESKTFICCRNPDDAGPLNNHMDPKVMRERIAQTFRNAFEGRTMYIAIFNMGPIGSAMAKICVQITDAPYVLVNARILARMDTPRLLKELGTTGFFIPCLHATTNNKEVGLNARWPCDPENIFISHFTDGPDFSIVSYGSGYGGNSLLGKKCVALRIASVLAQQEGDALAEHMLLMGARNVKTNEKIYITTALPSACGKTNLAGLKSAMPGEIEFTTLGDDIAWLKTNPNNGRLYAVNAENGFFGVAPGTNFKTNPMCMTMVQKDTIFTNVALKITPADGNDKKQQQKIDVWWEGMECDTSDGGLPEQLLDWTGQQWTPGCGRLAAHPNSRFTVPLKNCPSLDEEWDNPQGVPISAILFGGRSPNVPLVTQANTYTHGLYMGLTSSSEQTAASAEATVGAVRFDPFSMRPFIGYNVNDYVRHWLKVFKNLQHKPQIYYVNWFRRDPETRKFLWQGYTKNTLVLKWIMDRVAGRVGAIETPMGMMPHYHDFDFRSAEYDFTKAQWDALMHVDKHHVKHTTLLNQESLFLSLGSNMPYEMVLEKQLYAARL